MEEGYTAKLSVSRDFKNYNVQIFKDNVKHFDYTFHKLTNAHQFIKLYVLPKYLR